MNSSAAGKIMEPSIGKMERNRLDPILGDGADYDEGMSMCGKGGTTNWILKIDTIQRSLPHRNRFQRTYLLHLQIYAGRDDSGS